MALVLPVLLCLGCGLALVSLGWTRQSPRASDLLLHMSLSFGLGLGIFSIIFFLARVFGITNLLAVDLTVFAILLASFFFLRTRVQTTVTTVPEKFDSPIWLHRILTCAFAIALCAAVYSAVL